MSAEEEEPRTLTSSEVTHHLVDVDFRSDNVFLNVSANFIFDVDAAEEAVCDIHLVSHGDILLPVPFAFRRL